MQNPSKELLKHSLIYGTSDLLNKIVAFFLLPIYTRYLSPSEYGILQILVITSNLVTIIVQMGLGSAIFKSVLYNEGANKKVIINTSFYFLIASSFLVLLPIWLNAAQICKLILGSSEHTKFFRIILVTIFFNTFSIIPLAKLRIEDASFKFSVLICSKFFLQLLMNIYFVVWLKKGIEGIIIAEAINAFIFSFVFTATLFNKLGFIFSFKELKDMLEFGLPLVPAALAMFILTMSDRYFLKYFSDLEQVGLYSVGYRFGMIVGLLVGAFQKAWPSVMFNIAKEKNARQIFSKNFTYLLFVLFFVSLCLSVFSKDIIKLITTERFLPAFQVIPLISLSFLCYGIYYYTAIGMNLKKKTFYQPLAVGSAAMINLFLNYVLIPKWGTMGAASSTFVSFLLMATVANKISLHFYHVTYQYKRILMMVLTFAVIWGISGVVSIPNILISILFKILLLCGYPVLLLGIGFFDKEEKEKIEYILQSCFLIKLLMKMVN